MSLIRHLSLVDALTAAYQICDDMHVAIKMVVHAGAIIKKAHEIDSRFFNGKTTRATIGGLFYLLGFRFYTNAHQKKIAYVLGTSDTSIRESYRRWLKTFPNTFSDVAERLPK
jgi:hypothetical protein